MLAFLLACHTVDPDAGDTTPADTDDSAGDTAPAPTGDSLDDAVPIEGDAVTDAIDPEGDVDYWSVDLDAGAFLTLRTITVDGDPADPDFDCDGTYDADPLDTVIVVYDPDGEQIAAADDWSFSLCGRDTLAKVRAEVGGTYVIAVTDWNQWADGGGAFGNPPAGGPDYTYTLQATVSGVDEAGGPLPDEAPTAVLAGDDPDEWDVTVATRTWLTLYHPNGTNAGVGDLVLELDDAAGVPLAVADDEAAFYGTLWGLGTIVPLDPGSYVLRVYDTDGVDAPDDWYWLWTRADDTSATNPEVEPDDTADVATALVTRAGEGEYEGDYVQAQFDGTLGVGDVDTFTIPAAGGQYVYLTLYSGDVGSLADATVTVLDVDGSQLGTDSGGTASVLGKHVSADGDVTLEISAPDAASAGYYLGDVQVWDSRRPW